MNSIESFFVVTESKQKVFGVARKQATFVNIVLWALYPKRDSFVITSIRAGVAIIISK